MKYFIGLLGLIAFVSAPAQADFANRGKFRAKLEQKKQNNNEIVLNIAGESRSFIVKGVRNNLKPQAMVMVLHGGGGNAENAEMMSDFTQTALKNNFIVIYPNGYSGDAKRNILLTWNAGHCCGPAMRDNVNDIAFFDKLIDYSIANLNVDKKRVFAAGMSNGAMMTHNIGIHLSHKVTAIATIVGTMFGDEPMPKFKTSALIINGAIDKMIPINGGPPQGQKQAWDGTPMKPVNYQAEFWAKANQCMPTPVSAENDKIIRRDFNCPNGFDVNQIIVKDGGHAWFGGNSGRKKNPQPSNSLDATAEIWAFFQRFQK
ncbi:MAG: hypothetical protein J0L55_15330 [Caulobacterales bacterium]|nr:hypothetical protein [Caulobacterales bacterium]